MKCIWPSKKFNSDIVSAKLIRCMYFSVAKNKADAMECYLEVLVKLLLSGVADTGSSLLLMYTGYNYTQGYRRRDLLLSSSLKGID